MISTGLRCRTTTKRFLTAIMGMEGAAAPTGTIIEQYQTLAASHPEHLLLLQVGEFYEFYGPSAEKAAALLEIALGKAGQNKVPFTGFPTKSLSAHLGRLVRQGESVVVCEQYKEKFRNSFKRRVARIITPGTITDPDLLDSKSCNYLLSMEQSDADTSMAWSDISTGQVFLRTIMTSQLKDELKRIGPKEILSDTIVSENIECRIFNAEETDCVQDFYPEEVSFKDFTKGEMKALNRLLAYIKKTQIDRLPRLSLPNRSTEQTFMSLPGNVMNALELSDTVKMLNITRTAPGARLFVERVTFPSMDIGEINKRLDAVQFYLENSDIRAHVRSTLNNLPDFARAFQRVASPCSRDIRWLVVAIRAAQTLMHSCPLMVHPELIKFADSVDSALNDVEGRVFKEGFSLELDAMYSTLCSNSELNGLEAKLRVDIGNDKLSIVKIRENYYIETPLSLPIDLPGFSLDNSTSTKLRYRNKELSGVTNAREFQEKEIADLESELLANLVNNLDSAAMDTLTRELSELDVASSSAELAANNNYCRPELHNDTRYNVVHGRHPLIEQIRSSTFIRNSLALSRFALITGPNMGGKSTILKQTALIAILAQAGLYVPAAKAEIGLIDAIFTRVGASDDILSNQSTFMVEMSETGNILKNATPRSLILMDEVGRGTAWEEGFALAFAIVKYLIDHVRARCLFATHYSNLASLVAERGQSLLKTDAIVSEDGSLIPLYSLHHGVAGHSFAVAVARVAGLPPVVLDEALRKWQLIKQITTTTTST